LKRNPPRPVSGGFRAKYRSTCRACFPSVETTQFIRAELVVAVSLATTRLRGRDILGVERLLNADLEAGVS